MTDETRATAKVLLDKHGPDASMQALTRAEECGEQEDYAGQSILRRVEKAIIELERGGR